MPAFTAGEPLSRFFGMVSRQHRRTPHHYALGLGGLATVCSAFHDPFPFILGNGKQEGQNPLAAFFLTMQGKVKNITVRTGFHVRATLIQFGV